MSMLALPLPASPTRPRPFRPSEDALEGAVELVAMHFPAGELNVLEAAPGEPAAVSRLHGARVTRVDLEAQARTLDALRTFDAPVGLHQVVVCHGVLERLDDPLAGLKRAMRTLAPGGLLLVAGSVPTSFTGLLAKFRPRGWLQDRSKRRLKLCAGPDGVKDHAAGLGLELVYEALTPPAWPQSPLLAGAHRAATWMLRLATAGLWRPELSDMVLVFRRDGATR